MQHVVMFDPLSLDSPRRIYGRSKGRQRPDLPGFRAEGQVRHGQYPLRGCRRDGFGVVILEWLQLNTYPSM